jgi:hypothetical protein
MVSLPCLFHFYFHDGENMNAIVNENGNDWIVFLSSFHSVCDPGNVLVEIDGRSDARIDVGIDVESETESDAMTFAHNP